MKLKRFGAFMTALTLSMSLPAFAVENTAENTEDTTPIVPAEETAAPKEWAFTDISNHFARDNIQTLYEAGMVNGYNNGDGTFSFYPTRTMSAAEAILFCTRIAGVDDATQELIYADRKEQMKARMPAGVESWAGKELSVAVELGILSLDELENLNQTAPSSINSSVGATSYLAWNIPREQVCMYLVRGMGLEALARSLSIEFCTSYLEAYFADVESITPAYRPYVYLLRNYGIFNGKTTTEGELVVAPQDSLTRGEMIAFVARSLGVMEEMGLYIEPTEYTTYNWASGTITDAFSNLDGTISLTLYNVILGETVYTLPGDVFVYDQYNMREENPMKYLVKGQYVRLVEDEMSETEGDQILFDKVLLFDGLTEISGTVSIYDDHAVTLTTDSGKQTYTYSRFTRFKAGETAGDKTVLDTAAGYTEATCYLDSRGTLVGVAFSGGTLPVTGIISAVSIANNGTVLTLTDMAGIQTDYVIPADAAVTVNQTEGTLSVNHAGRPVVLRIAAENGAVSSVSVDTLTLYAQGAIVEQGGTTAARTVTIANTFDGGHNTVFTLAPSTVVTYDGETRTTDQIENGWFATVKLVGGLVSELTATTATTQIEGIISDIEYGDTATTITVEQTSGGIQTYLINMAELTANNIPLITREGKNSSPAQLRKGDSVVITLRYHALEKIEATPRTADLKGEIIGINQDASGMTIKVKLTDETEVTYSVGNNVKVTKNGTALTYRDLSFGDSIAFIVNGDHLEEVEILSSTVSTNDTILTGTVYGTPNNKGTERSMYIRLSGVSDPVYVDLRTAIDNGTLQDLSGKKLTLIGGGLKSGDQVTVFGDWNGSTFVAAIVIRTVSAPTAAE